MRMRIQTVLLKRNRCLLKTINEGTKERRNEGRNEMNDNKYISIIVSYEERRSILYSIFYMCSRIIDILILL
jgi:hypothetical protein